MKHEEIVKGLEKRAGILNYAIPIVALQAMGSKLQTAFGKEQDLSTPEGRLENKKEDMTFRTLGAVAGLAAGLVLNRGAGKVRSFRMYNG